MKGIDRVDLFVGGLAEKHINGGMVGQTFWVVLHEQFDRLQEGDRLYYIDRVEDFDFYSRSRSKEFAEIIARNTGLTNLPENVFQVAADNHPGGGKARHRLRLHRLRTDRHGNGTGSGRAPAPGTGGNGTGTGRPHGWSGTGSGMAPTRTLRLRERHRHRERHRLRHGTDTGTAPAPGWGGHGDDILPGGSDDNTVHEAGVVKSGSSRSETIQARPRGRHAQGRSRPRQTLRQ